MFEKMCQMPNLYVLVSNILAMRHIAVPKARKDGIKHVEQEYANRKRNGYL